jgi:hypothetical protein
MGLTIMYNTQDYWVFGLCPSSGILKNKFWKLDLFPSLGEGVADIYSITGPIKNLVFRKTDWN